MKLTIKRIDVKNFKIFESLLFEPRSDFNIIIGENNIGKSTIFEAIQLWKKCYDFTIKADGRNFYKTGDKGRNLYLPFSDLYFLRITHDTELFKTSKRTTTINIIIGDLDEEDKEFNLEFEIVKPSSISNAYYKVRASDKSQFNEYAEHLSQQKIPLSKAIFIYQTRPVANVLAREPIMNVGQISKKIKTGKSQEVLRNKIVIGRTEKQIEKLRDDIKDIVEYEFDFDFVNSSKKETDEYLDLKIKINGKSLDLHLQGSGFLQVAEIFSTIRYVDAPLSILLVDEPDSHIHTTLQKSLINKLKSICSSQIFVISHNDNFVGEAKEGELFYLNSKVKTEGKLESLKLDNFDLVKKELGGTIIALEKMNKCSKFVFVEGDDDIQYIQSLIEKYNLYSEKPLNDKCVTFFHQRGKDYLKRKLDSVNRVFSQIVGKKPFVVIYDKDFSTEESNQKFATELMKVVPKNSQYFYHKGYCVESVLFEDEKILSQVLQKATGKDIDLILQFIANFKQNYFDNLKDVTSDLYKEIERSFDGQKTEYRPELSKVNFCDFVKDCYEENSVKLHYVMNKKQIRKFINQFDKYFSCQLLTLQEDSNNNEYTSKLFELYLSKIQSLDQIYPSYKKMLQIIYAEVNQA